MSENSIKEKEVDELNQMNAHFVKKKIGDNDSDSALSNPQMNISRDFDNNTIAKGEKSINQNRGDMVFISVADKKSTSTTSPSCRDKVEIHSLYGEGGRDDMISAVSTEDTSLDSEEGKRTCEKRAKIPEKNLTRAEFPKEIDHERTSELMRIVREDESGTLCATISKGTELRVNETDSKGINRDKKNESSPVTCGKEDEKVEFETASKIEDETQCMLLMKQVGLDSEKLSGVMKLSAKTAAIGRFPSTDGKFSDELVTNEEQMKISTVHKNGTDCGAECKKQTELNDCHDSKECADDSGGKKKTNVNSTAAISHSSKKLAEVIISCTTNEESDDVSVRRLGEEQSHTEGAPVTSACGDKNLPEVVQEKSQEVTLSIPAVKEHAVVDAMEGSKSPLPITDGVSDVDMGNMNKIKVAGKFTRAMFAKNSDDEEVPKELVAGNCQVDNMDIDELASHSCEKRTECKKQTELNDGHDSKERANDSAVKNKTNEDSTAAISHSSKKLAEVIISCTTNEESDDVSVRRIGEEQSHTEGAPVTSACGDKNLPEVVQEKSQEVTVSIPAVKEHAVVDAMEGSKSPLPITDGVSDVDMDNMNKIKVAGKFTREMFAKNSNDEEVPGNCQVDNMTIDGLARHSCEKRVIPDKICNSKLEMKKADGVEPMSSREGEISHLQVLADSATDKARRQAEIEAAEISRLQAKVDAALEKARLQEDMEINEIARLRSTGQIAEAELDMLQATSESATRQAMQNIEVEIKEIERLKLEMEEAKKVAMEKYENEIKIIDKLKAESLESYLISSEGESLVVKNYEINDEINWNHVMSSDSINYRDVDSDDDSDFGSN